MLLVSYPSFLSIDSEEGCDISGVQYWTAQPFGLNFAIDHSCLAVIYASRNAPPRSRLLRPLVGLAPERELWWALRDAFLFFCLSVAHWSWKASKGSGQSRNHNKILVRVIVNYEVRSWGRNLDSGILRLVSMPRRWWIYESKTLWNEP